LYTSKHPVNSADILNDRVIPFFDEYEVPMLRILTDRVTEYCGKPDTHEYQLFLALNDIDHTKTKAKHLTLRALINPTKSATYLMWGQAQDNKAAEKLQTDYAAVNQSGDGILKWTS
jgi:hypothetical protein